MLEATILIEPQVNCEHEVDAAVRCGNALSDDLEARQAEVLGRLDELNERILAVLREFGGAIAAEAEAASNQGGGRETRRIAA